MIFKALIVEQLDVDGTLRTFRMQPAGRDITVAFADDYEEDRPGPFHFLDEDEARRFEQGFGQCGVRKIGKAYFSFNGQTYHFEGKWSGIPTERDCLSCYALSLPEFAIPVRLSVTDPHRPRQEYKRAIRRDDTRRRYVVYLKCSSARGQFDFDISCDFKVSKEEFSVSEYNDLNTQQDGPEGEDWRYCLDQGQQTKVQIFFMGNPHMGDNYLAGQAGAMGPNAQASNMTFQQIWNEVQGSVDLPQLARQLEQLQSALRAEENEPARELAIGVIAAAKSAAEQGDGPKALGYLKKAGVWAFDVATKIGVEIAAAAMRSVM